MLNIHTPISPTLTPIYFIRPSSSHWPKLFLGIKNILKEHFPPFLPASYAHQLYHKRTASVFICYVFMLANAVTSLQVKKTSFCFLNNIRKSNFSRHTPIAVQNDRHPAVCTFLHVSEDSTWPCLQFHHFSSHGQFIPGFVAVIPLSDVLVGRPRS